MKTIHKGKEFEINGSTKTFYGTLYCVLGDTPAAQYLGGFKEGVSMAKYHAELAISLVMNLGLNHLNTK